MKSWLTHNLHTFFAALRGLIFTPFSSLLSIAVIGIALSMPCGIYVLLGNIATLSHEFTGDPQITLFIDTRAKSGDIAAIDRLLKASADVKSSKFVSKTEALQHLQSNAGLADVSASLEQNPLPDAFIVTARDFKLLEKMQQQMAKWPKVEHARLDSGWVKKLDSFLKVGQVLALIISTLLGLSLVFITFNTIRLQILTRREEIEVARLIGATDSFIRRPFLYHGMLQGLFGGMAALAIVALCLHFLNSALAELAELYKSQFSLSNMSIREGLFLLFFAAFLGWIGAWLSVSRHLWRSDSGTP